MWVETSDKKGIINIGNCSGIDIRKPVGAPEEEKDVDLVLWGAAGDIVLGKYPDEEQAIEVLLEIENFMKDKGTRFVTMAALEPRKEMKS